MAPSQARWASWLAVSALLWSSARGKSEEVGGKSALCPLRSQTQGCQPRLARGRKPAPGGPGETRGRRLMFEDPGTPSGHLFAFACFGQVALPGGEIGACNPGLPDTLPPPIVCSCRELQWPTGGNNGMWSAPTRHTWMKEGGNFNHRLLQLFFFKVLSASAGTSPR